MTVGEQLGASFRDPSGFVFVREGKLYRQVNGVYGDDFELLQSSGLLDELTDAGLLIPHSELSLDHAATRDAIAVLEPERIPFISYPYEWCFGQLKDAALLTLELQKRSLKRGMSLKDASAYNVQYRGVKPVFIDSLSFEAYEEGSPWVAYGQFCRHFLAPLVLAAWVDPRFLDLSRIYLDGIPLDLASKLLPGSTKLRPGLAAHIHLHARAQSADSKPSTKRATISKTALFALVDSLESTIHSLTWDPKGTEWANYYAETNYSDSAAQNKRRLVAEFLEEAKPTSATCWDLGANNGEFAELAAARGLDTIAWDIDPSAVEQGYRRLKQAKKDHVLPLINDLTNPSPNLGWAGRERDSILGRGPAGVVMALALVHHLAIGNNVPLTEVMRFLGEAGEWAIVEFVPVEDSQVQHLLRNRRDIFHGYSAVGLERAFEPHFTLIRKEQIGESMRTLYLLRKR
jgi:hypothetical protein